MYPPVGTPGRNGGVEWGRYPPHPPNPGWSEATSKNRDFCGILVIWGIRGIFSFLSLLSPSAVLYNALYPCHVYVPPGGRVPCLYGCGDSSCNKSRRVETRFCKLLAAFAEAQRELLGSGAARAGTRTLKVRRWPRGRGRNARGRMERGQTVAGRFVRRCRRFVRWRGHHGDEISESGYDGCGNGTDSD